MSNIRFNGAGGTTPSEKFSTKTAHSYDPWRGQRITFVDVWLAENAGDKDESEAIPVDNLRLKVASEDELYRGFESELAEIRETPYDEFAHVLATTSDKVFFPDEEPSRGIEAKSGDEFFPE